MFPRRLRLPRAGFSSVTGAFRATSPHFSASFSKGKTAGVAVIVSKDVAKHSVDRHRLRRRVAAVLRPFVRAEGALIVRARKGAPLLSFEALATELEGLMGRISS